MPRHTTVRLLISATSAVLLVGALAGCAPAVKHVPQAGHSHAGSTTPSTAQAAPTPTPTPTTTWPPPLPANALFQISATVTAPGGMSANLVQTVYNPAPITAAQKTTFNTACKGLSDPDAQGAPWLNNYATADVLSSTMTATLNPGSAPWDNKNQGVLADFMAFGAFSGAYEGFEAGCAPGFIEIPGTETAIAPIQSSNPSGQNYGWAGGFSAYGFYGGGNSQSNVDLGGKAIVANCHVQLSPTAQAVPAAAAWATKSMGLYDGCDYSGPATP